MLNTKIYILCIVNVAAYIVEPTESDVKQKEKKNTNLKENEEKNKSKHGCVLLYTLLNLST